jgi:exosortase/archaeosortase family protein
MLLFLLGWPPVFDRLVSLVADPIAQLDATLVGVLAAPLAPHAQRVGQTFLLGRDSSSAIGISSACAGLAALFSMALVGAFLPRNVTGSRRAKLLWFGCALALVFAANLARLTAVVVVAERAGLGAGFRVFHASAGILLFSVSLLIMLRLLRLFRLRLTVPRLRSAPRLRFKARGLVLVASLLLSLSMLGVWTESGFGFLGPGSFAQTPTVASDNMLPAPPGMQRALVDRLPFIEVLFGHGARSYEYDFNVSGRTGIGAQIVVVPTLSQIRSYGALDCFVFHRYKIYAGHLVQLRNGGTAMLAAMRIAGQDVATISWYQPVRLDGEHAWRRVILFQYLTGQPVHSDFKPSLSRRVGYWLLNTLAPLGSTHPPQRFLATERELRAYANAMSIRSSA